MILCILLGYRERIRQENDRAVRELRALGASFPDGFEDPIGPNFLWTWIAPCPVPPNGYFKGWYGFADWFAESPLCITGSFWVFIENRELNEREFRLLGDLVHLHYLSLGNVDFPVESLAIIPTMSELKQLGIESASLTDDAVRYLKRATQLESLILRCPQITSNAIQSLRSALPHCDVYRED
jgi:hypothetical protein